MTSEGISSLLTHGGGANIVLRTSFIVFRTAITMDQHEPRSGRDNSNPLGNPHYAEQFRLNFTLGMDALLNSQNSMPSSGSGQ
jgi:hypothetical protein